MEDEADVGEELAVRVVSAAQRRRVRRLVIAGLVALTLGGGLAVGLTHRSGADRGPAAVAQQHSKSPDPQTRAEIYAAARAFFPDNPGSKRHVVFGRLVVHGDHARLPVSLLCGPLCGLGEELTLAREDGTWQVTAVRHTWIS